MNVDEALGFSGNAKAQGVIWDDANPLFENYRYRYQVRHGLVAVKGKLLGLSNNGINPWVAGSVGIGINRSVGYVNQPLIEEAVVTPNFRNHTIGSLAYTL